MHRMVVRYYVEIYPPLWCLRARVRAVRRSLDENDAHARRHTLSNGVPVCKILHFFPFVAWALGIFTKSHSPRGICLIFEKIFYHFWVIFGGFSLYLYIRDN